MTETALAQYSTDIDVLAGMGGEQSDVLKPTNLILVQKPEQGTPGMFRDTITQMETETVQAVPISVYDGRVYFVDKNDFGVPPLCRSIDGKQPVVKEGLVRQDGGLGCKKCEKAQWGRLNGKAIRPPCDETMTFLFIDAFTEFLYRFNTKGTGIIPTRNMRESVRKFSMVTKAKGKMIPPFGVTVELSSTKITGRAGYYYVVNYGPPTPIQDSEAVSRYYKIWDAIVNKKETQGIEDPVEEVLDGEYVAA